MLDLQQLLDDRTRITLKYNAAWHDCAGDFDYIDELRESLMEIEQELNIRFPIHTCQEPDYILEQWASPNF